MNLRLHIIIVGLIFTNVLVLRSQGQYLQNNDFSRHFTGLLDTNMHVSIDVFSHNGIVEGQYYYFFQIPGSNHYQTGKTRKLAGSLSGEIIKVHEIGNENSIFSGHINGDSSIIGKWQRKKYENALQMNLHEDYSKGSIPLRYYSKKDSYQLEGINENTGKPIGAEVDIQVLFPDNVQYGYANDSVNFWISKIAFNNTQAVASTELLVENIIFDFFQSYVKATTGIVNIGKTSSFDWKKEFSMSVVYNENNLLSLCFTKYAFTGGAHGIEMKYFKVFRLTDFKRLQIDDLVDSSGREEISKMLEAKLRRLNGIDAGSSLRENGFFIDELALNDNFYINNDGIGFYYNVYEIASYSSGTYTLFLPFSNIKQGLNKSFLPAGQNWK